MRLLVASDQWFPDFAGGSARVVSATARLLAGRGHEVTVLVPSAPGKPAVDRAGSLTLHRALPRSPLPQTLTDPLVTTLRARRLPGPFDVAVAHQATTFAGLRLTLRNVPLVRVFHASALRELRFLRERAGGALERARILALEPFVGRQERASLDHAALILVLSDFSRSLVVEDAPGAGPRVRLVGGGVDAAEFAPGDGRAAARRRLGIPADRPVLVSVRRFEPRMGLEELVRAMTLVRSAPDALLALVGSGVSEGDVKRLATRLQLGGRVLFPGRVNENALRDWYRAADLFVLPTAAYEGFGMVTAEALACGTPVLGTPVGATPELLRPLDPSLVADGTDAGSLAAAIDTLLRNGLEELRAEARRYASERLSWNQAIERWEEALEEAAR